MPILSKHVRNHNLSTLSKWVQNPSIKRGKVSPFLPKLGHRHGRTHLVKYPRVTEKDLQPGLTNLPWGGSSMLIKIWTPSILCSIYQACGFHSQGYLMALVGSWCSSHHDHIQAPGRKKGWMGTPFRPASFFFPRTPTLAFHLIWPEFSHMATSSCRRVWELQFCPPWDGYLLAPKKILLKRREIMDLIVSSISLNM